MKAIVILRAGGPEVLELREVPDPPFGLEDVRVRVRGSALNRADLLQRRGLYPAPPGAPADIPGLEFAGEVEACGAHVQGFRSGDRVMGILGGGGHAEKVSLHERLCLRIPPALGYEEAAAIPEAFLTAYDALFLRGRLTAGETVLVNAAGSGVGTAAALLATVSGARVIALARSAEKRGRLEALGLARVLDPGAAGAADAIRMASGGDGVHLVVDLVGASAWTQNVDALAVRGRMVLVGMLGGGRAEIDLSVILRRRLEVIGTVLRSRPLEEKIALVQRFAATILPLFASGRLRAVVDRVVPLDQAPAAHAAMERNENFGKVVLRV